MGEREGVLSDAAINSNTKPNTGLKSGLSSGAHALPDNLPEGVSLWPNRLNRGQQEALRDDLRSVLAEAPLFVPTMPRTGKPMGVRMTNMGRLGWVTDKEGGYRYQDAHPVTGKAWPAIHPMLISLWHACAPAAPMLEACLVRFTRPPFFKRSLVPS
ncbi:MAG: alpha-ketoglutarate-dependent dioxygenase AlkB [Pseudomonadota bacterium]